MNTIERDSPRAQAQEAFTGLLASPLLAARVQPALFASIQDLELLLHDLDRTAN